MIGEETSKEWISPLVLLPHENPVFPAIYAPTDGFIWSVGIIIKPFGNKVH